MDKAVSIAIVGGGLAGLATANALAGVGFEAEVFERAPTLAEIGAGINISPQAVKALRAIGLGEKLAGIESPTVKAQKDIKQIYGINLPQNSGTIKQVVSIAQSEFGGRYCRRQPAESCADDDDIRSHTMARFSTPDCGLPGRRRRRAP